MRKAKVAIVYDWIDKWGGVERLLITLHKMYPNAQWFTSYYDPKTAVWAKKLKIKTSFLQNFPDFIKKNRALSLLFYPLAFRQFDFSKYENVISVSSAFAKGIKTNSKQKHIAIILTPPRFLWTQPKTYIQTTILHKMVDWIIWILKKWDFYTAQQPNILFSISNRVKHRVKTFYKRNSELLYPPFDFAYWNKIRSKLRTKREKLHSKDKNNSILNIPYDFQTGKPNYYLVVSRLEKYKKIDLVIESMIRSKYFLIIVGAGSQEKKLKKLADGKVIFYKNLSDMQIAYLYSHAKALIMPQDEDFGYTSLEAQLFGCRVISYKYSGVSETIIEGKTGVLFNHQTPRSLTNAIERLEWVSYNNRHESDYLRGGSWYQTLATFKKKISQAVRKNNRRTVNPPTHRRKTYSGV